jgi:hypothetical protein
MAAAEIARKPYVKVSIRQVSMQRDAITHSVRADHAVALRPGNQRMTHGGRK